VRTEWHAYHNTGRPLHDFCVVHVRKAAPCPDVNRRRQGSAHGRAGGRRRLHGNSPQPSLPPRCPSEHSLTAPALLLHQGGGGALWGSQPPPSVLLRPATPPLAHHVQSSGEKSRLGKPPERFFCSLVGSSPMQELRLVSSRTLGKLHL